jgi:hypothetical protein
MLVELLTLSPLCSFYPATSVRRPGPDIFGCLLEFDVLRRGPRYGCGPIFIALWYIFSDLANFFFLSRIMGRWSKAITSKFERSIRSATKKSFVPFSKFSSLTIYEIVF